MKIRCAKASSISRQTARCTFLSWNVSVVSSNVEFFINFLSDTDVHVSMHVSMFQLHLCSIIIPTVITLGVAIMFIAVAHGSVHRRPQSLMSLGQSCAAVTIVVIVFVSSWWATTGGELRHHHSPFSAVSEVCIVVRTFDGHAYEPKGYTLSCPLRSLVTPEHTNWGRRCLRLATSLQII